MENKLKTESFYNEMESLISPLGLNLVEAAFFTSSSGSKVSIYLTKEGGATSDDLERVYDLVYLKIKSRFKGLTLEVSTPGCTRKIKDAGEFIFFVGKTVRVYSDKVSSWIDGIITNASDKELFLSSAYKEDNSETKCDMTISYDEIKKARLTDIELQKEKSNNGKENNKKH